MSCWRGSTDRAFSCVSPILPAPPISRQSINHRDALLVLQIDQNFERQLQAGQQADVQVIADGRNSNTAGTAIGYVNAIVDVFQRRLDARRMVKPRHRCRSTSRAWYNPNLETRWNMMPALIGTLTMLQTLLLTAMSVAREREQGTFDQLLVTPFRPVEIMIGKAIPSMIIGTIQATLDPAGRAALVPDSVRRLVSHPLTGLGLFLLAAVGIGLLLSSVVDNHAAGDALLLRAGDAFHAALGPDDVRSATCRRSSNT